MPEADGNVIADFTGMLHDCGDGLAFVIEHSSKYTRAELEALCKDFFETLLGIIKQENHPAGTASASNNSGN